MKYIDTVAVVAADSVAYEFGPGHGVMTYNFAEDGRPDSKSDILTFSFMTLNENSLLVRVTSASTNDYLELALVCTSA